MIDFKKIAAKYLRDVADKIDRGNCELTEEEAMRLCSIVAHEPLSKEQAANYLNLSPSRFDDYVRMNKLPKGRKRRGHKELDWYKDELDSYKSTFKRKYNYGNKKDK